MSHQYGGAFKLSIASLYHLFPSFSLSLSLSPFLSFSLGALSGIDAVMPVSYGPEDTISASKDIYSMTFDGRFIVVACILEPRTSQLSILNNSVLVDSFKSFFFLFFFFFFFSFCLFLASLLLFFWGLFILLFLFFLFRLLLLRTASRALLESDTNL